MRLTIDRIDKGMISYDAIWENYLKLEIPVVISGEKQYHPSLLNPDFIKENYGIEACRNAGWFDSPLKKDDPFLSIPAFIKKTLQRDDVSLRRCPMRIFMHPKGQKTLAHFDGNSLSGFNWQIVGQKRWILTSPNTPLPCAPFSFFALVPFTFKVKPADHDFYDFMTFPGDILFLPRYWFHEVHSIGEKNINVNWVYTPMTPNRESIIGRRECELLKLRKTLKIINRLLLDDFEEYGGNGKAIINNYIKDINLVTIALRFIKEMINFPKLILLGKDIKFRARLFAENNFNVN